MNNNTNSNFDIVFNVKNIISFHQIEMPANPRYDNEYQDNWELIYIDYGCEETM